MNFLIFLITLCYTAARAIALDATWWNRHAASISCSSPGYFVNPADCHSFYRCVDRSTWNKPALQRYDFTCPRGMVFDPAVTVCTQPGSNGCADPWWDVDGKGKGRDKDNAPNPSTDSNSLDNLPPIFGSDKGSDREFGGAWFDRPSNAERRQDSGSPEKENPPPPSSSSERGRPSFNANFQFGSGGGGGRDPLDDEFDFGSDPPLGGDSDDSDKPSNEPITSDPDPGTKDDNDKCGLFGCSKESGSNSRERNRGSSNENKSPPARDWFNRPSNPDKNRNSIEFDLWSGGGNNNKNRPASNWGGASRPVPEHDPDPWRTITPWISDRKPIPLRRNDTSWWDPPYPAVPYRPPKMLPPSPPEPWANPFRTRYPVYQIVRAYPTWPGPYNRIPPVLVIYSNSKK